MATAPIRVSWEFAVRGIVALLRNPSTDAATVDWAEGQLMRLARMADDMSMAGRHARMTLEAAEADAPTLADCDPVTGQEYGTGA